MIRQIVDDINKGLEYSFKDVLRGIAYPVLNKTQVIPGDRDGNKYQDCVPDDTKKSIVYWEDYGTTRLFGGPRYDRLQTAVRLVAWLNFKLISHGNYDQCVREILNQIPRRIGNEVFLIRTGQEPKTSDIFSRYTYREGKQYVGPPYDVMAFNFNIRYMSTYCKPE